MLGSASDADDVLQEAWLRLERVRGTEEIHDLRGWLTTTVSRLCLDRLRRVRREDYVGPWLPEPVATLPDEIDRESVSFAFLCLLERLSPTERAVFLLHTVFELGHEEIATALGLSHAAVRQQHKRAKDHLAAERPRFAPSKGEHEALLSRFAMACATGNAAELTAVLAANVRVQTDGGGKSRAALNVVNGADAASRFLIGLIKKGRVEGVEVAIREINGWPALVGTTDGVVDFVTAIETDGQMVAAVFVVVNPDKLRSGFLA